MKHPDFDDFWKQGSYDNWPEIAAPALNITGWWDMNFPGAPLNFENMRREGATPDARDGQKLIIGPWPHWVNKHRSRNGVDFGEHAIIELDDYIIALLRPLAEGQAQRDRRREAASTSSCSAPTSGGPRTAGRCPAPRTSRSTSTRAGTPTACKGDGGLSTAEPAGRARGHLPLRPRRPGAHPLEPARRAGRRPHPVHPRRRALLHQRGAERAARRRRLGDAASCGRRARRATPTGTRGSSTCTRTAARASSATACLRARFRDSFEQPELLEPGKPYLFEFTMDADGHPLPARPPDPGRADELVVHAVRPQHQLGRGEHVHGRPAGRGRPDRLPRRGARLARRPAGDPAVR